MTTFGAWISRLRNAGVLVVLAGLGYWGHATHWAIPSLGSLVNANDTEAGKTTKDKSSPTKDDLEYRLIEFDSTEAIQQVGIACDTAIERELPLVVGANATVGYDQTKVAQVSTRVSGLVWKVLAAQGRFVRQGDLLAIIDSPEVGQARTDLLQDFSSHYFAAKRLQRLQTFAKQGALSEASLREAESAELETRARCFSAQQKLLNLGLETDLATLRQQTPDELSHAIQWLGLCKKTRDQLPATVKTANLIPLVAPLDGVVTQYDIVVGERITPDRNRIEIADVRTMRIRLAIRKEDSARLALGQIMRYTGATHEQAVTGRLDWISTDLDERTRTVQARSTVANPLLDSAAGDARLGPWLLRANEYGTTQVTVGSIPCAVMVPAAAIQRLDGQTLVFIARPDGKSFEPRKVVIGEASNGWVQIRSGVTAGERLATANSFVLKSEMLKDALEGQ